MNSENIGSDIAFAVRISELQELSIKLIGRQLDDLELYTAIKGIEAGLSFDLETVLRTAVEEATSS